MHVLGGRMHGQIFRTIFFLILLTYNVKSARRTRPSRTRGTTKVDGKSGKNSAFFCSGRSCGEGKYCNKQKMCMPTKFDGQICTENKECMSDICLKGVCKSCRNDGDCPSKGARDERLLKIVEEAKAFCVNNDCVKCTKDEHCNLGRVCTIDNRCEQCDSNEDCKSYLHCERGIENWCVQCYKDDHCPTSKSHCLSKRCVECIEGSDCPTGRCDSRNECVGPLCDGWCFSNAGCISGQCQFHSDKANRGTCKYCGEETNGVQ
ncbi:unnamed protein product [Owenia fusiformis]|uniref:Uncharacterized protein n=1 Tax=Owenia fusiformis TaxID=6347 RepID=A0A8J1U8M7_OWEFU|nr:unnamed protein product [Owenia fusiformis]